MARLAAAEDLQDLELPEEADFWVASRILPWNDKKSARWWCQIFLLFSPPTLGKGSNLMSIFSKWVKTQSAIFWSTKSPVDMTFNRKTLPGACGFCCKPGLGVVGSMVEAAYPYRTCHHQFACWIQEFFLFTFDACCILYLAFLETHGLGYKKVYPFESSGLVFLPGNLTWKRRFFSVPSKTLPPGPGSRGREALRQALAWQRWARRKKLREEVIVIVGLGWVGLGRLAGPKGPFFFSPKKKITPT